MTVVVGTDHHPFARLVGWADARQRAYPDEVVTVQHGYTPAPATATGVRLVAPDELNALLESSDVVVTHGGPGTVMGARNAGHHPLVLPRDPRHGEHVDEHQLRFSRWAADKGLVDLVEDLDHLDRRVADLGTTGTRDRSAQGGGTEAHALAVPALLASARAGRRPVAPGAVPLLVLVGEPAAAGPRARALADEGRSVLDAVEAPLLGASEVRTLMRRRRVPAPLRAKALAVAAAHRAALDGRLAGAEAVVVADSATALALAQDRHVDLRVEAVGGPVPRDLMRALRRRGVRVHEAADLQPDHHGTPDDEGAPHDA